MTNENGPWGSAYKIGKIGRPHGVKGEVVFHFTDDVFDRVEADFLLLEVDDIMVPFFMEEYRFHGNESALVTFEDIDTQEKARRLTGCDVYFPRELSDADEDELHYSELVGYTVLRHSAKGKHKPALPDGKAVIAYVDQQTENIMFELQDGTLLPANEDLIMDIDREAQTITLVIPEGLV